MVPLYDIELFERNIAKATQKYLVKKYYWNSYRVKEIIEVFGESKYKMIYEPGTCIFTIIMRENNKKIQFTCEDVKKRLNIIKDEFENIVDCDISSVIANIFDEQGINQL